MFFSKIIVIIAIIVIIWRRGAWGLGNRGDYGMFLD